MTDTMEDMLYQACKRPVFSDTLISDEPVEEYKKVVIYIPKDHDVHVTIRQKPIDEILRRNIIW